MKLNRVCGIIFCMLAFMPVASLAHHQVVLVTNTSCPLNTLSSLELRKIYFGIKVRRNNFQIRGLRNLTNSQLDKIFHQTVVAMTSKSYSRRLLAQILNSGTPRIAKFYNTEALKAELSNNTCNITYMWEEEVIHFQDLKIIKLLWQKQ